MDVNRKPLHAKFKHQQALIVQAPLVRALLLADQIGKIAHLEQRCKLMEHVWKRVAIIRALHLVEAQVMVAGRVTVVVIVAAIQQNVRAERLNNRMGLA